MAVSSPSTVAALKWRGGAVPGSKTGGPCRALIRAARWARWAAGRVTWINAPKVRELPNACCKWGISKASKAASVGGLFLQGQRPFMDASQRRIQQRNGNAGICCRGD
jgi:hypothetical protein